MISSEHTFSSMGVLDETHHVNFRYDYFALERERERVSDALMIDEDQVGNEN